MTKDVSYRTSSGIELLDQLAEPTNLVDPSALYANLRERSPVAIYRTQHLNPLFGAEHYGFVSRHAEARYVMTSSDFRVPDLRPLFPEHEDPKVNRMHQLFLNNVFALNPPLQTERRAMLAKMLTARAAERLREITERLCEETVASVVGLLRSGAVVNIHQALSEKVALDTIATFLGVPAEDRMPLKPFAEDLLDASHPIRDDGCLAVAVESVDAMQRYFSQLLDLRRRSPQDDLTSRLVVAIADGHAHENDVVDMLMGLWISGFLSTAAGIDAGIVQWSKDRAGFTAANRTPAGGRGYANEILRLCPPLPVSGAIREATDDLELGGVAVPRGTQMIVLFGPVNRDPAVFEDPEAFLPGRNNAQSMSFGSGAHYCVGAHFARMEISTTLAELDRQLQGPVELGRVVRRQSLMLHTYDALEIRLAGRRRQASSSR